MEKEVYAKKAFYDINDLLEIMKILCGKNGCPWDKEQDHHSIRMDILEEAYEVMEAIDSENSDLLKEELGDVLLQVVFHAELESEKNVFDFNSVCDVICKKLIYRHPHVFGNVIADNSDDVLKNWDILKSRSKGEETSAQRLKSVPKLLPALMRGQKVCKRAANASAVCIDKYEAVEILKSETLSLEKAISTQSNESIEEALGNVLFSCCNLASILGENSEEALSKATAQFIDRFEQTEHNAAEKGVSLENMPPEQLKEIYSMQKSINDKGEKPQ